MDYRISQILPNGENQQSNIPLVSIRSEHLKATKFTKCRVHSLFIVAFGIVVTETHNKNTKVYACIIYKSTNKYNKKNKYII